MALNEERKVFTRGGKPDKIWIEVKTNQVSTGVLRFGKQQR